LDADDPPADGRKYVAVLIVLVALVALYLFAIVDAALGARRASPVALTAFNRARVYVAAIVAWNLTGQVPSIVDITWGTYSIPSAAMLPNLEVGDYIVAWKGFYRSHEPERGQVIFKKWARDGKTDYVKRIIGLPGDHIQMRGGALYINGSSIPKAPLEDFVDHSAQSLRMYRFWCDAGEA
jgi:signal peptidase I